jgi:hypothetical protein
LIHTFTPVFKVVGLIAFKLVEDILSNVY